jgi:hypothetical protein
MSVVSAAEMKQVTTTQVVLILGLATIVAATVVILALSGLDPVVILTGITTAAATMFGVAGWAKAKQVDQSLNQVNRNVDQVKDLSNGRLTEVMEDNKRLHDQVAALSILVQPVPLLEPPREDNK